MGGHTLLPTPIRERKEGLGAHSESGKRDSREWAEKKGLGSQAHIGDEGPEALHDVGAVMTLEYDIQVHEDPLILFLVPRASHLLHRTVRGGGDP